MGTSLNSKPLLCCRLYHRWTRLSLEEGKVRGGMHSRVLSARTLYATDKPLFQVLDNMNPGMARLRGITMVIHHSHRAQLLASLLQHPLIFVFPGCVVRLNLSSKQQVVLCILMTCGTASGHTRKISQPHV